MGAVGVKALLHPFFLYALIAHKPLNLTKL
jgi:hypothetical protein